MSHHKNFIEHAKAQLDKLGEELGELDRQIKSAGERSDAWSTEHMHQLRADWHECQAHVERMSAQSEASLDNAKAETERHWKALEAAVKTYREQLQTHAA